ncbi:MAG: transposase [Candidatus Ventricola sp.]
MPFIRAQKIVRDESGTIVSGSASIVDTEYVPGAKYHSRQVVRERLGRVIELDEGGRSGLFASPTRGLVRYDADKDAFEEASYADEGLAGTAARPCEPSAHVMAGDALLLFSILESAGVAGVLAGAFPKDGLLERVLAHLAHSVLRDGSHVSCEDFAARSAVSHLLPAAPPRSLRSDTAYFCAMGADSAKVAYFKALTEHMRESDPSFGECCYVDSTPLPGDAAGNPFNALSCHGTGAAALQCRLVLVLDSESGVPVWYDVVPGNVLDVSTLSQTRGDAEQTLGVRVGSAVLDAGYACRELLCGDMHYLVRMPARRGYPYKSLYHRVKGQLNRGKYAIARGSHTYFGRHFAEEVLGQEVHCYVYVDKENALARLNQTLSSDPEGYAAMLERDKDWEAVRGGYFVLMSDREMTAAEALDEYFGRMQVESFFKTAKSYLGLLPLSKWTDETVRGKILHDMISTVALLEVRKAVAAAGKTWSATDLWGKTSALMGRRSGGSLILETPSKQARERFAALGLKVPAKVDIADYRRDVLHLPA